MIKSFAYAITGILEFFRKERNARIHLVAATGITITGFLFHISRLEWMIIVVMIMSVLVSEMINTSIEALCNHLHPAVHEQIRIIKDIAAGAVLTASIASVVIAAIIFIPKIIA